MALENVNLMMDKSERTLTDADVEAIADALHKKMGGDVRPVEASAESFFDPDAMADAIAERLIPVLKPSKPGSGTKAREGANDHSA